MNNWSDTVAKLHQPLDKALFRALSLVLAFYHLAMVMWDSKAYSESIGGFNPVIAPLMIWSLCASMVFGIGFKPKHWIWQVVFSPYFSLIILLYLTFVRLAG
ncbi:cyd operon protein YbgE [Vibrio nitrifigilis]|uniref:Cyd operon protein YbgE n=1 Tax=Vibrio nitrifigilis TaxID=2789781 RepID=A0ABS0GC83_9VIBR|nr:cyd operon protein YbgE [Vibrio nitrifigilis]MBF9000019.1 cyd operon protein YbgE [Vibrio nitrifigilis]